MMSNQLSIRNSILKKPVVGIREDEKNKIKEAVGLWGKQAKDNKSHKSVDFIVERDKLLVEWLFNTGMRISDALSIKFRDINLQKEDVTFIIKKRSRKTPFIHTISLDKSILFEIQRFKQIFLLKDDELIFNINRSTVDANLKKYSEIAGFPKYSAHKYRHGCAMKQMNDGLPDFVTSFRLGHSDTTVTNNIYRRMNSEIERKFLNGEYKI